MCILARSISFSDTAPAYCTRAGRSTDTSSPKISENGCRSRNPLHPAIPAPGSGRIESVTARYHPTRRHAHRQPVVRQHYIGRTQLPLAAYRIDSSPGKYAVNNGFGIGAPAGQATSGFECRGSMARRPARGRGNGGEAGIRTLGRLAPSPVFETGPFDRSGTSPTVVLQVLYWSALASSSLTGCRFRRLRRCSSGTRRWSGSFAAAGATGRWPRRRSSRPALFAVPRCAEVRRDGAAAPLCVCPSG